MKWKNDGRSLMRRSALFASLALAVLGTGAASAVVLEDVEIGYYDPSAPSVELMEPSEEASVAYTTDTAVQAGAVSVIALASGSEWSCCVSSPEDSVLVAYSVTGSGTLPSLGSISSIAIGSSTATFNTTTRTFSSTEDATEMAIAVLAAKLLPDGVSFTQAGSQVAINLSLAEAWIGQ